ncbi:MAG: glycerophosphodiester phosphodiesterase [Acholeplasmatales bacterium]
MIKKGVLILLCSFLSVIMFISLSNIKANTIFGKQFSTSKIKLPEEYLNMEEVKTYQIPNVYEPTTGIINAATVIQKINNLDDLKNSLGEKRPATILMDINESLEVIDRDGNVIKPIKDILKDIEGKIIPAFSINEIALGNQLVIFLKNELVKDFFLFSEKDEVIKSARENNHYTRGVLDLTNIDLQKEDVKNENLIDIRNKTNKSEATAVLLPLKLIDYDSVRYLQKRLITVFTTTDSSNAHNYESILSGVNGIITNDFMGIFDIYETFPENSIIRKPFIINHRGLSSYTGKTIQPHEIEPENSVYAVRQSIDRGAEIIEIDIHITKDKRIVVHHDMDTSRLFNKKLVITNSTLAELQDLSYKYYNYKETKIDTFDDFMENFKDDDVVFFIEIKSWVQDVNLVQQVCNILEEKAMMDRAVIISFVEHQMVYAKTYIPELSVGYLSYAGLYSHDITESVEIILDTVTRFPTTINHSYVGLTKDHVKALTHRGITVWPWTINGQALDTYYLMGTGGNTTDTMQYYQDAWLGFEMEEVNFIYDINNPKPFRISSIQYALSKEPYEMVPDYEIVDDGGTGILLDRGQVVSAKKSGTTKIMVWMDTTLPNNTEIRLYRGIITIEVINTKTTINKPLIIGVVSGGLVVTLSVVAIIIKKKIIKK